MKKILLIFILSCLPFITPQPAVAGEPVKLWERSFGLEKQQLTAMDVTVDDAENVYVTGYAKGIVTVKYNHRGEKLWDHTFTHPSGGSRPCVMVEDSSGNIYIAGKAYYYHCLLKYDAGGNPLAEQVYNGIPADTTVQDTKMALFGEFVFLGVNDSNGNGHLLKINSANPADYSSLNIPGTMFRDLTIVDGRLMVLLDNLTTGNTSYLINVYDTGLNLLHSTSHPSGDTAYKRAGVGIVSNDNDIYVVGKLGNSAEYDIEVLKFSYAEEELTQLQTVVLDQYDLGLYDPSSNRYELLPAFTSPAGDNLIIGGDFKLIDGEGHYLLIKLDSDLSLQWCRTYRNEPAGGMYNGLKDMVLDSSGNIYLTGVMGGTITGMDTLQYSPDGSQTWLATRSPPLPSLWVSRASGLAVGNNGSSIYVAGYGDNSSGYKEMLVINYGPATWTSYSDEEYTVQSAQFASPDHMVFMRGTGYHQLDNYVVAYYDGDGEKVGTENIPAQSGTLTSRFDLRFGGQAGTWHAAVFQPGTSTPESYAAAAIHSDLIIEKDFSVAESAIPEFSGVVSALAIAASCAVIYLWLRKRVTASV